MGYSFSTVSTEKEQRGVGKRALVTGASKGIGKAIKLKLEDNGFDVFGLSREQCDLIEDAEFVTGKFDVLINNAGRQLSSPSDVYPRDVFRHNLELMAVAPLILSQNLYPYMHEHGGHIINILSTSAFQGARNIVGYVAAKHALLGITRSLAIEWAPEIHVNAVAPGLTDTDMTRAYITPERKAFLESITPSGRFSKPEEIADAVMFLVNSTNIYGQVITVDGGWMAKNG